MSEEFYADEPEVNPFSLKKPNKRFERPDQFTITDNTILTVRLMPPFSSPGPDRLSHEGSLHRVYWVHWIPGPTGSVIPLPCVGGNGKHCPLCAEIKKARAALKDCVANVPKEVVTESGWVNVKKLATFTQYSRLAEEIKTLQDTVSRQSARATYYFVAVSPNDVKSKGGTTTIPAYKPAILALPSTAAELLLDKVSERLSKGQQAWSLKDGIYFTILRTKNDKGRYVYTVDYYYHDDGFSRQIVHGPIPGIQSYADYARIGIDVHNDQFIPHTAEEYTRFVASGFDWNVLRESSGGGSSPAPAQPSTDGVETPAPAAPAAPAPWETQERRPSAPAAPLTVSGATTRITESVSSGPAQQEHVPGAISYVPPSAIEPPYPVGATVAKPGALSEEQIRSLVGLGGKQ